VPKRCSNRLPFAYFAHTKLIDFNNQKTWTNKHDMKSEPVLRQTSRRKKYTLLCTHFTTPNKLFSIEMGQNGGLPGSMYEDCCMVFSGYLIQSLHLLPGDLLLLPWKPVVELSLPLAKMPKWLERGERGGFVFSNLKKKLVSQKLHEEATLSSPPFSIIYEIFL
jgi:hypothetical protein